MTTAAQVIVHLQRHVARLAKLGDEAVGGFAFVLPPEGEPIEFLTLGVDKDPASFYEHLKREIVASANKPDPYGGPAIGARR